MDVYPLPLTIFYTLELSPNNVDAESIPMTQRQISMRNGRRSRRENGQTEEESRTMKQVVKMLVAVVVLFAICWGPILIDNVLTAYRILPRQRKGIYKHMNTAFHLMAYFNSCINPIVYGFMSKHFRESFLSAACGGWWICCPRRGYRTPMKRHSSLSQTRTTSVREDKLENFRMNNLVGCYKRETLVTKFMQGEICKEMNFIECPIQVDTEFLQRLQVTKLDRHAPCSLPMKMFAARKSIPSANGVN
ncbi:hypothetical protein HZH66_000287 [Vespula vulgaris]|uniref:G-protein coupled receptors family 1 profile domain-containing protein n=1 Tax=Vespula vulgaris TaxID=7454 RepID=A0A834KWH0_VESVU|nr:hypothetical protein HZH66_000287 [Vespula vulgaris]